MRSIIVTENKEIIIDGDVHQLHWSDNAHAILGDLLPTIRGDTINNIVTSLTSTHSLTEEEQASLTSALDRSLT